MATIVEGNPKVTFSIATTLRCRGGRYSFPGWLHFTLDLYLIMLSVKQGGIKYHFLSLWYDSTWDWTQVSRAIGEHSNRLANVRLILSIWSKALFLRVFTVTILAKCFIFHLWLMRNLLKLRTYIKKTHFLLSFVVMVKIKECNILNTKLIKMSTKNE